MVSLNSPKSCRLTRRTHHIDRSRCQRLSMDPFASPLPDDRWGLQLLLYAISRLSWCCSIADSKRITLDPNKMWRFELFKAARLMHATPLDERFIILASLLDLVFHMQFPFLYGVQYLLALWYHKGPCVIFSVVFLETTVHTVILRTRRSEGC